MENAVAPSAEPPPAGEVDTPEELLPPAASLTIIRIRRSRRAAQPKPLINLAENAIAAGVASPSGPAPVRPGRGTVEELVEYWTRLCVRGRLPSPADLNFSAIATAWPNTVLLNFEGTLEAGLDQAVPRAIRLTGAAEQQETGTGITMTPMVANWLLVLAREALDGGEVVHETERFPDAAGGWLEAVLLPLSMRETPDCVLYHLRRA
jgi:hypothetical protein